MGLAVGDQIDVRMYDLPDLGSSPIRVTVNPQGSVHLPYAGNVQVMGLSPDEIGQAVAEALKARGIVKDPNVSVEIFAAVNMVVHVLGEVRNPQSVQLFAPVPVSFLLGKAGGVTGLAARHLTIVHHSDEPPTSVDFDPDAPTSAALRTIVNPGDIVNVSRIGVFFAVGEVQRPGVYPMGGGLNLGTASATSGMGGVKTMTLMSALAQCGGITSIAARSKITILRTVEGKREIIVMNYLKLGKGEEADPILHSDDIIYVPSSYIRTATNNLFSTAVTSLYAANLLR